jgi:hypothetical protein
MISIETLNLPTGPYNCLKRSKINTVDDLLAMGKHNLLKIRKFGNGSLALVIDALEAIDVTLTDEGLPLPSLSPDASNMLDILNLGDTKQVRQGLAKVIYVLASYAHEDGHPKFLRIARELHGL